MTNLDVSGGIVAMVHDNQEMPLIDISGLYLSAGIRHKLSYKKRNRFYLSTPYTDCTMVIPPSMQAMFREFSGADFQYSQGICNILCTQAYM